jgi:hypothetical protein
VRDSRGRPLLLPILAAAGAVMLLSSAFATVISVDVASGSCEQLNDAEPTLADRCVQTGFERHSIVFPLLALAVVLMALGAWRGGSRPAAAALVAFGAVAAGITVLSDLPASNNTGVIGRNFAGASAQPGAGLWLALFGGLLTILAGAAGLSGHRAPRTPRRNRARDEPPPA